MSKPVFIIKYPCRNENVIKNIDAIRESMDDYHVLFVPIENIEFQFECFNVSGDPDNVSFELLQERVIKLTKLCSPTTAKSLNDTEATTQPG